MKHTMRQLKTSDIFKMSKILKKMNIKFEINQGVSPSQIGLQMVQSIAENLHLAEDEVNAFLADLVGLTPEKFAELPIEETLEVISLFKEQKGIANFLKLAGK